MSVSTLVGTPDPDHTTPMPSPTMCTCIFTASTAGPFGVTMRVDAALDPTCPRHRRSEPPASKHHAHLIDRLDQLRRRVGDLATDLGSTTRPKHA